MREYKIAVFLTFHNRREKTVQCARTIFEAAKKSVYSCDIEFFACDDGSTDGTAGELCKIGLPIHVIQGDGNLFWARGMAKAIKAAKEWRGDFYLMVNDDVEFNMDLFNIMIGSYENSKQEMCAIVGSTKDKVTGEHTYGGLEWNGKAIREVSTPILPAKPCKTCNKTNWNCFLIPVQLYKTVGDLDNYYEHSWADFDYSIRLTRMGYRIFVAYDYIGFCSRNPVKGTWGDTSLSIKERFKAIRKKNGLPAKSSWHFCRKFYGIEAPFVFVRPYLSILKAGLMKKK